MSIAFVVSSFIEKVFNRRIIIESHFVSYENPDSVESKHRSRPTGCEPRTSHTKTPTLRLNVCSGDSSSHTEPHIHRARPIQIRLIYAHKQRPTHTHTHGHLGSAIVRFTLFSSRLSCSLPCVAFGAALRERGMLCVCLICLLWSFSIKRVLLVRRSLENPEPCFARKRLC